MKTLCDSFLFERFIKKLTYIKGGNPRGNNNNITNIPKRFIKSMALKTDANHQMIMTVFILCFSFCFHSLFYITIMDNTQWTFWDFWEVVIFENTSDLQLVKVCFLFSKIFCLYRIFCQGWDNYGGDLMFYIKQKVLCRKM